MSFSELIAIYLFLGGTAAGAFALAAITDLGIALSSARRQRRGCAPQDAHSAYRHLSMLVNAVAFIMMLAGLLCLLADLGRPEAFYLLFISPSGSVMSLGTFALTLLAACMAMVLAQEVLTLGPGWRKAALFARVIGIVFAIIVMVYAGLLLQTAVAVPLWRSGWLWVLFLSSSLSCGSAVLLLCACACEGYGRIYGIRRRVAVADAVFIVLEAAAAVAFIVTVGSATGVDPLALFRSGGFAALFWLGFVGCGILVPLAAEVVLLISGRRPNGAMSAALAVLVLVGGLCLRLVIVGAGVPAVG